LTTPPLVPVPWKERRSFCACHNRASSMLQNPWLEHDFACLETDHYAGLVAGMEENGWCHSMEMILVYASLATIDGFIALAAAIQLLRLYVHNRHASWTRQKVIHCMICASNFGMFLFLTVVLARETSFNRAIEATVLYVLSILRFIQVPF